jgi:hypothetical protein
MPDYIVRFSLKVSAEDPGVAVDGLVDLFTEKGLRDWVYRVDNPDAAPDEDALIGFFDGYGDPMDVAALLAEHELDDSDHGTIVVELPSPAPDAEDVELHELAESLNQANEEPVPSIEEQALAGVPEYSDPE